MKAIIHAVLILVLIVMLSPVGVVSADSNCPEGNGWRSDNGIPGYVPTTGRELGSKDTGGQIINQVCINGIIYSIDTTEGDFLISGIGTTHVSVTSTNVKIFSVGFYLVTQTAIPTLTATQTITVTPTVTATPLVTATATMTETPITTASATLTETIIVTAATTATTISAKTVKLITLTVGIPLALAAIIISASIIAKKKH